jgi:hypothetical protein
MNSAYLAAYKRLVKDVDRRKREVQQRGGISGTDYMELMKDIDDFIRLTGNLFNINDDMNNTSLSYDRTLKQGALGTGAKSGSSPGVLLMNSVAYGEKEFAGKNLSGPHGAAVLHVQYKNMTEGGSSNSGSNSGYSESGEGGRGVDSMTSKVYIPRDGFLPVHAVGPI